jgi:hypothetical protein
MLGRFVRRPRLALTGLALCAGLSGAVLVATGGAAYASQAPATYLAAESSGLYLDVSQYGGVIQNQVTYSTGQYWSVPEAGSYGRIKNFGYNACVTTDGVPGDQLYLKPCARSLAAYQTWYTQPAESLQNVTSYNFSNPYFGLDVEVDQEHESGK